MDSVRARISQGGVGFGRHLMISLKCLEHSAQGYVLLMTFTLHKSDQESVVASGQGNEDDMVGIGQEVEGAAWPEGAELPGRGHHAAGAGWACQGTVPQWCAAESRWHGPARLSSQGRGQSQKQWLRLPGSRGGVGGGSGSLNRWHQSRHL